LVPSAAKGLANEGVQGRQIASRAEDGLVREAPAVILLAQLREIWPPGEPFMATTDLIGKLIERHPNV